MTKKLIALLLVLCMVAGMSLTAAAAEPTLENSVNMDQLIDHAICVFRHLEAGDRYNSVVNTSTGCVGMGIMGWIGSKALQLLKWACADDPSYCLSVLGEALYNEVVNAPVVDAATMLPNWKYWRYRVFSSSELAAAKTLLGSEVGIRAQHNLARNDITIQARHGWSAGVRTEAALIYYCSAENHYGEGSVKNFMNAVRNALGLSSSDLITSLDQFHQGTVAAAAAGTVSTLNYRTKVYKYLTETLGLPSGPDNGSVDPTDPTEPTDPTDPTEPTDPADPVEPEIPFTDLPDPDHWAYDAIIWAYTSTPQITGGTSATTFSPDGTLTRAEAMTFLWAAAGSPDPVSGVNPFKDNKKSDWFYNSVLWAVENKYTGGTSATTYSPRRTVTTCEMLTFLWAFAGHPTPVSNDNPFTDVGKKDFYYEAVVWACNDGILVGNEGTETTLNPTQICTRAYVVTYLYNYFMTFMSEFT